MVSYTSCISKVFVTAGVIKERYSSSVGIIGEDIVISCVLYKSVLCGNYTSCISKVFVTAGLEECCRSVGIMGENIVIYCVLYKSVLCGMLY